MRLLPAFDQYVVCASRRVPALLDPKRRQRIYRLQGWVSPVLLINGRLAEAERLASFLGGDLELRIDRP